MSLGHIHLTPQFVQAVRDAVDVVPLAEDHTKLRKQGSRYLGLCPLHKEKTPSFSVDPDRNLFYCFGCGAGGDAIKLHMMVSGDDFPAAIESLARRFGVPLPRASASPGSAPRRDLEGVLEAANEWFREQLASHDEPKRYLESRRIDPELVERYELGYAPPAWDGIVRALGGRLPLRDLEAGGLVSPSRQRAGEHYDRFRQRLMFPIRTATGRLVGFGGRTLGDDKAKYVNTPETERFQKGTILYGLDQAKRAVRETGRVVVVEGYFDVLAVEAAAVPGAVATMGTALTPEQARLLARYADEAVVAYDGDTAGEKAYRRALPILLHAGLEVRRLELPPDSDPDTVRLEEGPEALRQKIAAAPDGVERELGVLIPRDTPRQPQRQGRVADDVADLLGSIPDPIVRDAYGRRAAERIGVHFDLLARRIRAGGPNKRRSSPGADRDESRAATSPTPKRSPGYRAEEAMIRELVRCLRHAEGGAAVEGFPAAEDLVEPEVFSDEECRNFFQRFSDLYRDRDEGGLPSLDEIRGSLDTAGTDGEFLARIVLGPGAPGAGERERPGGTQASPVERFLEYGDQLLRQWLRQRRDELVREIREAARAGDEELVSTLSERKESLAREYYGKTRPRL